MTDNTQAAIRALERIGRNFNRPFFTNEALETIDGLFDTVKAALQSKPVDVEFPIMALKDAAAMLDRTPTKGGVTELGAENCRKAIAQLQSYGPSASLYGEGEEEAKGKDGESPQGAASLVTKEDIDD